MGLTDAALDEGTEAAARRGKLALVLECCRSTMLVHAPREHNNYLHLGFNFRG